MRWKRRSGGFTLIELLVVLVILGSLVSLAVLSTGSSSSSREVRDEARRIAALIGVLADEAVLDNREYGLAIDSEGYRVLNYDETSTQWRDTGHTDAHRLPEWMRLDLELDGTPLRLAVPATRQRGNAGLSRESGSTDTPEEQPQLLILSSGELSPFRLKVSDRRPDGATWVVASDGFQMPVAEPLDQSR